MAGKIKGDINKIKADIAPYVYKAFLKKSYVEYTDIKSICHLVLSKYTKVNLSIRLGKDGKPYLIIKIDRLLFGGELSYEVHDNTKGLAARKSKDSLDWIDRIEDLHAMLDD